ncbi:MAG: hypothetical protein M3Y65_24970 [Pseudomonadota bacterium]|nr:hypothetical protein [Pseudomonadota bacterium]
MKTTQKAPQLALNPPALSAVMQDAAHMLARMNPAAFASRPRSEALAAVRAALAVRPGSSTPAECQALARKGQTGAKLADKLEAAEQYTPAAFATALVEHGIATRVAVVELLRAYLRLTAPAERLARMRAETAARRRVQSDQERAGVAARAATKAARPDSGASLEDNARAAAGYARLKAAGAFA